MAIIIIVISIMVLFVFINCNHAQEETPQKGDNQYDYSEFIGRENNCEIEEINNFGNYYYSEFSQMVVSGTYSGDVDNVNGVLLEGKDGSSRILAFGIKEIDSSNLYEGQEIIVKGEMTPFVDDNGEESYGISFNVDSDGIYTEVDDIESAIDVSEFLDLCDEIYKDTSFITTGTLIRRNTILYLRRNDSDTFYDYIRLQFKEEGGIDEYINKEITIKGTYYPFSQLDGLRNVEIINE